MFHFRIPKSKASQSYQESEWERENGFATAHKCDGNGEGDTVNKTQLASIYLSPVLT